jgi:membrane protease YdiL (CAAX protease family)
VWLSDAIVSALTNLVILVGIPFLPYYIFHKWRRKRGFVQITQRAGLRLGEVRYIGYCLICAAVVVGLLIIWPPSLEPIVREGSAWSRFVGLGLCGQSVVMALLYGVVMTGFAEEFLFRGLIAGSLSRRLSMLWANVLQAVIFLAPHLLILLVMPEMWYQLIFIFAGSLFAGWVRIKSGSIVGTWLIHASVNVTMGLSVAIRTAT